MPRYKLTIAYDGADFHGWQRQELFPAPLTPGTDAQSSAGPPGTPAFTPRGSPSHELRDGRIVLRTVQDVVQQAVRSVVRQPVTILGASRTDSGVHARGQVAAFSTINDAPAEDQTDPMSRAQRGGGWPAQRGTDPLRRAINSRLPEDVLVRSVEIVPADFDPIAHAVSKEYTYALHVSPDRPLWRRRTVQHIWTDLDVSLMRAAASELVGRHDFAAFAAAGHGRLTTVRTVLACGVEEAAPDRPAEAARDGSFTPRTLVIRIRGDGFLWNMVRIIAGTLVEAGRGRISVERVRDALRTGDRRLAGPTLPPTGLCLEWVRYNIDEPDA